MKQRKRYTGGAFKVEAVRLTEAGDKTIADAAFALGLAPATTQRQP